MRSDGIPRSLQDFIDSYSRRLDRLERARTSAVTSTTAPSTTSLTVQDNNATVATDVTQIDFQGNAVAVGLGAGEVVVTVGAGAVGVGYTQTFNFATAATLWTINHNQNTYDLNINTFTSDDNLIVAEIDYVSPNTITVSFYYPTSGYARVFN